MTDSISMTTDSAREGEAAAWTVIGDLPCLDCGYNLRNLRGPVIACPECGMPNDLHLPEAGN